MAVLGKRKAEEPSISEEDAAEVFRRHFESRFAPLPDAAKASKKPKPDDDSSDENENDQNEDESEDDENDEEWGGVSGDEVEEDEEDDDDDDTPPIIEVVDHSAVQIPKEPTMSKRELKAFMSSRVPDQTSPSDTPAQQSKSSKRTAPEDAPSLLKQDLELRRLISESHLLKSAHLGNASVFSAAALGGGAQAKSFDDGRTRRKATDLRVQALGSKTSILKQEKMPMHMRKGMNAAAGARESKRRREAKENGVILERAAPKKSRKDRPRDRGVDAPGMGKFKGAELKLNKNDIRKLEGSRDTFGRQSRR